MHFFGTFGSLIFFIGFVIASYLAYTKFFMAESYTMMTDRPLFYFGLLAMMVGSQLFLTGFLADMISRGINSNKEYQVKSKININKTD